MRARLAKGGAFARGSAGTGAMNLYRSVTLTPAACLAIAAPRHVILLMSDSPAYRMWVWVQIALLVADAVLFWLAARGHTRALARAMVVSIPAIYVNFAYVNYGIGVWGWITPAVVLVAINTFALSTARNSRSGGCAS